MPTPRRPSISEKGLQDSVLHLAKVYNLRTAHFRAGMNSRGVWMTAVAGDGKGFPDLVILGPAGVLFRELKTANGRLEPEQQAWLAALTAAGLDARVWRPEDWLEGRIRQELWALTGKTAPVRP